ncbi:phosphatidylinositol-3-phosphate-binding ubiquitin-protein ligase CYBJADRAFT_165803 [Cyberlindnera jadinii NRRL Y-1542]|uniref:RING-type E3 ubiquitin transferase n=1 Tax=Cyberlindnera jadinii (strain ATCC 18201 / CBS 1600 / BCRC 20928 / JCM 3617 / NBRC 0987 / NRRL Y-1542) TaxID=983966 RepID=A0A1E4SAK6_CYBJN|nr:hypothetical protein CYBJADRAFT_165803 [Cyberlindnera jadinii NRRL Y-1542]ODV76533.1 hypothetical protein CYBJADRAFT_165803 [Cyberlindnera jadinii NRRL Y-1542]
MSHIVWQADEDVSECWLCHKRYTFFFRRHHCRRCGKVVCGDCSRGRVVYEAGASIISSPHDLFAEPEDLPHRTCDFCFELMMSEGLIAGHSGAGEGNDDSGHTNEGRGGEEEGAELVRESTLPMEVPNLTRRHIKDISAQQTSVEEDGGICAGDDASERDRCPVCNELLTGKRDSEREQHINDCLTRAEFLGSPDQHRVSNRMLVYYVPFPANNKAVVMSCSDATNGSSIVSPREAPITDEKLPHAQECVICLEELEPGDKVGRLECLCVFHYKCIKAWFKRKGPGECPIHAVHA